MDQEKLPKGWEQRLGEASLGLGDVGLLVCTPEEHHRLPERAIRWRLCRIVGEGFWMNPSQVEADRSDGLVSQSIEGNLRGFHG